MCGFPCIVIENGIVHAARGYEDFLQDPHAIVLMVIKFLCYVGLPDLNIVINPGDDAVVNLDSKVRLPIWSWTKTSSNLDLFMPYWNALWLPEPEHLQSEEEWNQRLTKMVFRGSSGTGHATSADLGHPGTRVRRHSVSLPGRQIYGETPRARASRNCAAITHLMRCGLLLYPQKRSRMVAA